MKCLLIPLLATTALPTAVNAGEKFDITCSYKLDSQETENKLFRRFIIDTSMDKGSVIFYEKLKNGKKIGQRKYMVDYVNSPLQIEIVQDIGLNLGFSHLFDKNNLKLVEAKDIEKIQGKWKTDNFQTKYKYFDCKKTPMFFFK
tara:strand:+ start:415 stop:846 length:432 start_codon:yes stop_codon:yes gene_type:complete